MTNDDELDDIRARLGELVAAAPPLHEVLRGTVRQRFVRCGKPSCHCQDGPGHGPVRYLSVSVGSGRTKQITLAEEDFETAQRYAANYRYLREILEQISNLNREHLRSRRRQRRGHE